MGEGDKIKGDNKTCKKGGTGVMNVTPRWEVGPNKGSDITLLLNLNV